MRDAKTCLRETSNLDITKNRNNPSPAQLDGTEEMVWSVRPLAVWSGSSRRLEDDPSSR